MIDFIVSHVEIIVKCLAIGFCGIMWRAGGSDELPKAVRRYGVPFLKVGISCIFLFSWVKLLSIPSLVIVYSIGYGVNSPLMKIFKNKYIVRYVCGLLYVMGDIPLLWGKWYFLGFLGIIVPIGVMLAGNQLLQKDAKEEESFIGILTGLTIMS